MIQRIGKGNLNLATKFADEDHVSFSNVVSHMPLAKLLAMDNYI